MTHVDSVRVTGKSRAQSGESAESLGKLAGHARIIAHPTYQRLLSTENLLKNEVPVAIKLFLLVIAATRVLVLAEEAEKTLLPKTKIFGSV